jgi:hypothetical protein
MISRGPIPGTLDLNDSNPDDFPKTDTGPPVPALLICSLGGLYEKPIFSLSFCFLKMTFGLSLVLRTYLSIA